MKRANGTGSIVKMTGNRRRPYAIRKVIGWREDGRPILKYISYHRTKREAEKALNEYANDPYTICNITLSQLYDEWYKLQEKTKADKTLETYRSRVVHLKPLWDMKLKDIDRFVLQEYYDNLDVTNIVCDKVSQLLNMLFKYAVKKGIMPIAALNLNKAVMISDKKETSKRPHSVISKEDIDRLWRLKDENEYARIILVYIYTGLRFSELRNLRPENCHDNYIEITHAKTPSGIRQVPLSDKVLSLLPIRRVPTHNNFAVQYKKLLPDHSIHNTRHTFISMMVEAGVDDRIIKAIVGHKSNDITDIYTHISLDVMIDAVNKI